MFAIYLQYDGKCVKKIFNVNEILDYHFYVYRRYEQKNGLQKNGEK